jgi:hypothetical protein
MSDSHAPPRLARRLLSRALPTDVRDGILADLDEVFARVARERGPLRARLWYRGEAVAFATRFLIERSRTRMTAPSGPPPISWLPVPWLDIKLGFRMLVKYPGLTAVGCMALAIGVGVAVGVSSLVHDVMNPTLDLPHADRVITIVSVDVETASQEGRILHDFVEWRDELDASGDALPVAAGFAAVLALSLAGIYAIVSFTVTQRRREIGIRTALGSQRWRIARTLVSRVMVDVAIGVALAWGFLAVIPDAECMGFRYLPAVVATVVLTGLATCLVPTARGVKVRPADALRAEG